MPSIKCPFCGKRHTVPIQYGMPGYEAFLDEQAGKIKLGGCVIMEGCPNRYCKDCKGSFGKSFEAFGIIENVNFFIGGYFGDDHYFDISLASGSYILTYRHVQFDGMNRSKNDAIEQTKTLSEKEAVYLQGIISKLYICEWPGSNIDSDILDGTQWSLEIKYQGIMKIEKHGSNKFPPYFPELLKAMSKLSGGEID